jgi:hypothetical protein
MAEHSRRARPSREREECSFMGEEMWNDLQLVERLGMQTRLTPFAFAATSFLAE